MDGEIHSILSCGSAPIRGLSSYVYWHYFYYLYLYAAERLYDTVLLLIVLL